MHFHHFALKALAAYLNTHWQNTQVEACFSQNRQELVLETGAGYLRAGCQTPLTYIAPGDSFTKARKNVVDLFPELPGVSFQNAEAIPYDRVLRMQFSDSLELIFKMHGMMANIILRRAGETLRIFRQDRSEDWAYEPVPGPFDAEMLGELPESASSRALKKHLSAISPIYDAQFAKRISRDMEEGMDFRASFDRWVKAAQDGVYYLAKEDRKVSFLLFAPEDDTLPHQKVKGIASALGAFLAAHFQYQGYLDLYRKVSKEVQKPVDKYRKVYASYEENIRHLIESRNPEEIGHLLMANLHTIASGAKMVELEDFYTGGKVKVKLKPNLSPQENAARYYDKNKQRKAKLNYLEDQLEDIRQKLEKAEEDIKGLEKIPAPADLPFSRQKGFNARQLREWKKELRSLWREQEAADEAKYPFRTFRFHNYDIFVGRSGPNNDLLTFKFASREDIWLHAKDVPGSHVIIRNKPGHPPPLEVLEYAAGLAAYYSKLRTETLAPVSYTPRKYVRKRKGDPPGMVAVDREEVIMIEPGK